ncbi:MAG: serine/threonine-protein kinase, partial [Gemmataceae bacterium]
KTIRRNTPRPRAALRALEREAATLQAVRHPSIVELLETRLSAPEPFLVMKHDAGHTLRDQLRASGPTDATTAVHVIRQTAEALAAVHQAGRIHGDIKSDNLLRKSTGRVVVLDFGFSHAPGDHPACGGQFLLMGTPNTMAPELCQLPVEDTAAADIYSLGIVFYELLMGAYPFPTGRTKDVIAARTMAVSVQIPPFFPAELNNIIEMMTQPAPGKRPCAAELVRKLLAWQFVQQKRAA